MGASGDGAAGGIASATVIGGGTMGLGIAECFAAAGLDVKLVDASPELTRRACDRLVQRTRGHVEAGLLAPEALERARRVQGADTLQAAVANTDLVLEAVPEDLALKEDVLAGCEAAAAPDAIIASNTSSLPITRLARACRRPGRFLGTHWFNPPEWTPGVEVIPAGDTDPRTVERVIAFLRAIGKRPAQVADGAGFVANRLQMALFREALACVEDGLASPAAVDEVVRSCFGFRLPFFGPFQIADMAGLDVYASVFEILERDLGPRFAVPTRLRQQVDAGRLGTKSGAGFRDYGEEERERLAQERDRRYAALTDLLSELPPVDAGAEPAADGPA